MTFLDTIAQAEASHPVDAIEAIANINDWEYERTSEDELVVETKGNWSTYTVSFNWMEEIASIHVSCAFELPVPPARMAETERLLRRINEQLWIGHFDMWESDRIILFRHSHVVAEDEDLSPQVGQHLIQAALTSCDQYYQAFQFVVWAGRTAQEAMTATMFETVGEA